MKYEVEAKKFLSSAKGKVGVLFHDDADGISSAALVMAYLAQKGAEAKPVAFDDFESVAKFAAMDFDYYIVVDLPPNEFLEKLGPMGGKPLLVVDHHPFDRDINGKNIIFVNPRMENPDAYVSASHCVYDLLKGPLKSYEWLMRVGATGDHEIEGTEEEAEAADMIGAVTAIKKPVAFEKLAVFLSKCKKIDEFLYNESYQKLKKILDEELEKQIAKYETEASGEITFFELKTHYGISGLLNTKLFDLYPKRTLILYRKRPGNMWSVSGRSHKYDIGATMKKAAEGIGTGGGHPVAAGAYVSDFKLFKKRLLELMK
jgi:single-stranded DNA-specific DHH superfamily exonuclease